MGAAFSVATLIMVLIVTFVTARYRVDSRQGLPTEGSLTSFFRDTKEILQDKYSLIIYAFYAIATQGMVLVATLQMYLYIYFMKFGSGQKSIAHGATMVGFAIGSMLTPLIARKIDKRLTAITGAVVSMIGNLCLAFIFLTGILNPASTLSVGGSILPIAIIVFVPFHAMYWMGNGILAPITFSMVADTAEINQLKTGILKDGSYSAMFSFLIKLASSLGLLFVGNVLSWIGFVTSAENQTSRAIYHLAVATFFSGVIFAVLAVIALWKYPVNKAFMESLKRTTGTDPH
jgi:GPH family glycoside/pentoside/hexuronide:cation symporter